MYSNDPRLLHQLAADRYEAVRKAVGDTRLRREARAARRQRRRAGPGGSAHEHEM